MVRKASKLVSEYKVFAVPALVLTGIFLHLVTQKLFGAVEPANIIILSAIGVGSIELVRDTVRSVMKRQFALDYIAILAILTGIVSGQYLVASVIVLMLTGGQTLEKYAISRAKRSLTALTDRIPKHVLIWKNGNFDKRVAIESVNVDEQIYVRKGEVIPLDGVLVSDTGLSDESSLTGEPYEIEKYEGDTVRSGTINIGQPMIVRVTKSDKDSTYRKIVNMVRSAQDEKSPLIRIADRYSAIFTIITLTIAVFAYVYSGGDLERVLAVLVIATPCPLILATPIALIGGMNALARRKIIGKTLASIEGLSRVTDIIFDKTGTLTLGKPNVTDISIRKNGPGKKMVLSIAGAIERNSLHPLAKAIVSYAKSHSAPLLRATNVREKIGSGITADVGGRTYTLSKLRSQEGFSIELRTARSRLAVFRFEDALKAGTQGVLSHLSGMGIKLAIYTGDKRDTTNELVKRISSVDLTVHTDCSPEDKLRGIKELKRLGRVTAMVGDGINDAPALASADVGMVFSNDEHTAASEAADLVFLGGDFSMVSDSLEIAKRTIRIAKESIVIGIGLSVFGMVFAAMGYVPPLVGAFLQEVIDVGVIFNALRASKFTGAPEKLSE